MTGGRQNPGDSGRRGVVLLAALAFVAALGTVVTLQMEGLPMTVNESRTAASVVQRSVEAKSALQAAVALLKADARKGPNDTFRDEWTRPCHLELGETRIEVKVSDWVLPGMPEDDWMRHDQGLPEGVNLLANGDPNVRRLLNRVPPNVNTTPLSILSRETGLSQPALTWLGEERLKRPLTHSAAFINAPGYGTDAHRGVPGGLAFKSRLFVVHAVIRRPDEGGDFRYWVLQREGERVTVLYTGPGEVLR